MTRFVRLAPAAIALALMVQSVTAQDLAPPPLPDVPDGEGSGLIEDGARLLFRGLIEELDPALGDLQALVTQYEPVLRDLAGLVENIDDYQAPELLENGDILIRRKADAPVTPVLPEATPLPDGTEPEPYSGQIDL